MEIHTATDFINKFHNLDGDLISERKKSFFTLLKNADQNLTPDDIDNAIENLKPTTYQEKLFYVRTLIFFKKSEPLIGVLKKCNRQHIKIILKQKWFIEKAFEDVTPTALVNKLFPCVSYSTRLKLLGRIPRYWPEQKNDELFDCVQRRYSFSLALRCLHTCSAGKIKTHLKEQKVVFTTGQIIDLLNTSEELFKTYFHCHYSAKNRYAENNVLNLLAIKSPQLLLELINNEEVQVKKLSATASIELINIAKKKIIEDDSLFEIFHNRTLVKKLGPDFKTFLEHKFSQNTEQLNSESSFLKLFTYYSKNLRWKLFSDAYTAVFPNKTIEEFLKDTDKFIITLNPDKETIFKWAEYKYKATEEDDYLTYFSTSVSIPKLKEKINVTSDRQKRQELVKLLISTCAVNEDFESLDGVLDYISQRHKNEDPNAYNKYIKFLLEKFTSLKLRKSQWNFVHRQIIFIKAQGMVDFFYYEGIVVELLKYSYKNDRDLFQIVIVDYLKGIYNSKTWYYDHFQQHFKKYEFKLEIFKELCRTFSSVISNDRDYYWEILRVFIDTLVQLSTEFPDSINMLDYPSFVTGIREAFEEPDDLHYNHVMVVSLAIQYSSTFPQYSLHFLDTTDAVLKFLSVVKESNMLVHIQDLFVKIVKKKKLSELDSAIISFMLENMDTSELEDLGTLRWNHPMLLLQNIEKHWSNLDWTSNYDTIKHYSHISMDKKLCEYLRKNWAEADLPQQKNMIKVLLNVLSDEDFADFFSENIAELDSEDIKNYHVQCHLVGVFKEVSEPLKYLPLLVKFCTETYITFALPSLYSFYARLPEEILYNHIELMWMKNTVLKKRSIFLSCAFLKQDFVVNLLRYIELDNHDLLKSVCSATLTYFLNTYNEELFPLLIKFISKINVYDKNLFFNLVKSVLPEKYRPKYVEVCWEIIENTNCRGNNRVKFLDILLKQTFVVDVLARLSTSFVNKVISGYLPVEGANRLTNVDKFTILCLSYRESEKSANYELTFDILSKLKEKNIGNFCKTTIDCYWENDANLEFIDDFIKNWNERFSLIETLNEHITLQLFQKNVKKIEELQAKNIIDYLDELLNELGPHVFSIFIDKLRKYLDNFDELLRYKLLYLMLNYKKSPYTYILIIKLLKPVDTELNRNVKTISKNIIEEIKTVEEPIVVSYYEMYLHNL